MGGKSLKIAYTERKTTEQFNMIVTEIIPILKKDFVNVSTVKFYHTKTDHGDMDILIGIDGDLKSVNIKMVNYIKEKFNPIEIYNNNEIISFDYNQFQIDFILIDNKNWKISNTWFSYDPIANLMGKTAHKFGCKYGFEGLYYPYRYLDGRISKNITLSRDNRAIFEFLGYDYDWFLKGFETMEEIFDFATSSKYFDYTDFLMENLNHEDRKRNIKRASYQKFLTYMEEKKLTNTCKLERDENKRILYLNEQFPDIKIFEQMHDLMEDYEVNEIIKKKFNGDLVKSIYPELEGKGLGNIMNDFQKNFDDFKTYALNNSSEKIMNDFELFYKQ